MKNLIYLLFVVGTLSLISCSAPKYFKQTDILSIEIDSTGKYLVTTNGESIIIWDASTLTPVYQKEVEGVNFADFLDERTIIYANSERISIYNFKLNEIINEFDNSRSFSLGDIFTGERQAYLGDYHLTPDRKSILFQYLSGKYEVTVVAKSVPELKTIMSKRIDDVTSGAGNTCIHPTNKRVVAISNSYGSFLTDAKLQFWEFQGAEPINTVKLGTVDVNTLALSNDGDKIYCGTSEGIIVLRFGDGYKLTVIGKDLDCRNVLLSNNGEYIASRDRYGNEGTYIWKVSGGSLIKILDFNSPFCFSNEDDKIYYSLGTTIQLNHIK